MKTPIWHVLACDSVDAAVRAIPAKQKSTPKDCPELRWGVPRHWATGRFSCQP
jgi:hypothetical protein